MIYAEPLQRGCWNRVVTFFILQRAMGDTVGSYHARYDFRAESSREKVCKNLEVFG